MIDPLTRECRTNFPALHHGGERLPSSVRYIVLHSTEGDTAEGAAEWFMQPASGGSANLVVDDTTCYRTLGDNVIPWGAPPLNTKGYHIEQAGFANWTRAQWMKHEKTIERAAYKASLRCKWYRIPAVLLDAAALERDFGVIPEGDAGGVPPLPGPLHGGIVTHRIIDSVYHESDHTDPGAHYPLDVFMHHLAHYLDPKHEPA